ncbi:sugar transferase [Prochlorococcus marinus]|uniref:sugar transferase n=1 Tax=Prochlorococcus marinus TaxID=1219 RepID=UPI0001900651|nr:sugar transferase [Prochlorococcus marinus]EEE40986.1 UDP-glucose lipid carrier transferase [Prochlorococcus marinus str. MIT 9202]
MIKKFLDKLFAVILLILLLPVLIVIAILIKNKISKDILFIQKRPGFLGRPFNLIKFKTMYDLKNENGELLDESKRVSNLGNWLRASSLDELPSLINIIKGELSFIGPRPLLMEYLKYYNKNEFKRHNVTPGLSGWAQINGRNLLSWEKKFEMDLWYVENRTLILDFKILIITIWKVIKRKGINRKNGDIMEKFKR